MDTGTRLIALLTLLLAAAACPAAERALDKEVVVDAPAHDVWGAWTTREGIVSFFAPDAQIDARAGGAFHIYLDPGAEPGQRGADDMRYLAIQPEQMLSFDWSAPPSLPEVRAQRTVVIVRLRAIDARHTQVTLHHVGWGEGGQWDQAYAYFDQAWPKVLASLKQRFETGPKDWSGWLRQLDEHRKAAAHSP